MKKRRRTRSEKLAYWVLGLLTMSLVATLWLGYLSIVHQFTGALPWVTAALTALNGILGKVLDSNIKKSQAENTKDGIIYEAARAKNFERDL